MTAKAKLKVGATAAVILVIGCLILWRHLRARQLIAENAALQDQVELVASLKEAKQSLSEQMEAASQQSEKQLRELVRLRGQVSKVRQLEEENRNLKIERDNLAKAQQAAAKRVFMESEQKPEIPWIDRTFGIGTQDRSFCARDWGFALIRYAQEHGGQCPARLSDVSAFLSEELSEEQRSRAMSELNRFEPVYHGHWDNLAGLPPESTIVIREKEPWRTENGEWAKIYVNADGASYVKSLANGDFASWETVRIPH